MKTDDLKPAQNRRSDRLAIIGIGCLFPGQKTVARYWANIREGIDAISEIPATHWKPADYYDPDPKAPDHTYGQRGGFLSPFPFNPMEFNIPPNTLEAIDTSQLLGMVAAGQALKDAGYGPERAIDRSRVSVILGVTGALELVIPLGARLGHPIWRSALKDAGIDDAVAEDVVQRIADGYVPWQENSFPGPARQRCCRADQQAVRPRRHQLRRRCRLRQLLQRAPSGRAGTRLRQGGHGRHRRHRYVQRYLHVHVLQQDPGAFADRQCQAV